MNPLARFRRWVNSQRNVGRTEQPEYECATCGRRVREAARAVHDEICPDWLQPE